MCHGCSQETPPSTVAVQFYQALAKADNDTATKLVSTADKPGPVHTTLKLSTMSAKWMGVGNKDDIKFFET